MEGLGALDHFNPRGGLIVAAGILVIGEDSAFAPKVALVDIVIVRDGDGGAVFDDFAKVLTEFQPEFVVLFVIVHLVAREEEDIRVYCLYVVH